MQIKTLKINSLENILSICKIKRYNISVFKTIFQSFILDEDNIKDLIIYLKNDNNFTPVLVIHYLMDLFNLNLRDASMLYQQYEPKQEDIQIKFINQ